MTTPDLRDRVKSSVALAIADLVTAFTESVVQVLPDGQGGAWVELYPTEIGDKFTQPDTFLIFLLPFNLPGADIYPMFVRSDLARTDGAALSQGMQLTSLSWPGDAEPRPVLQISRRTRGSFAAQSAPQKVNKVIEWLRTQ
jgi:hypothetical protein